MKVNRSCELCRQKVTEVMHCVNGVYSVDFVGDDNSMKLKARVNPNILLAVIERYGEHGKITNLRFDGEVMTPRGGGGGYYGQSGYYLPSCTAGSYYPNSSYSYPPPPPYAFTGNYAHPTADHAPRNPHTTPPSYTLPPPAPRPLYSFSYVEPQYRTSSSSGRGRCVIM
ncbi:hypothetical protein CARUB_v10014786mg [Capsella rubella]|uniref:HMA domain-containing protein n=2 Tax=Capsella rubella TaxID=81985 RepID=R0I145_9BRAS|nr:hypothetical protein CARUB_v10014786mg [Capsella rubella]